MNITKSYSYSINGVLVENCCTFSEFIKNIYNLKNEKIKIYLNVDTFKDDNPLDIATKLSCDFDVILKVSNDWENTALSYLFESNKRISLQTVYSY